MVALLSDNMMNGCWCNLIILTIVYFVCECCVFIFSWRYMFLYGYMWSLCYHTAMHPSPSPYGTKLGGSCSIGQIWPYHSLFYLTIVRLDECLIEVLSLIIVFLLPLVLRLNWGYMIVWLHLSPLCYHSVPHASLWLIWLWIWQQCWRYT